ncbi:MAG: nitrous oxide reductase accessory protein NosL [Phycisphaerae bacterium]|nr:nitrous oxide reductase accessory protein NosL [Phycisphaerae bacterium]
MKNLRSSLAAGCVLGIAAMTAGCSDAPSDGPPVLRVGRDECSHCGMMIAEDRCSAALLVELPDGRGYRLFDDLGCLLDYERTHRDDAIIARFSRDYAAREWVPATTARYVMSEAIQTPMGSWLVAFGDEGAANAARETHGGTLLSWADLPSARINWLKAQGRTVPE